MTKTEWSEATTRTREHLLRRLRRLGACESAREWAATRTSAEAVWTECERGDWLLWLAARAGVDRREVVLAACAVARTALQYVRAGEERPRIAIETAERWARGEASIADVRAAAAATATATAADAAAAAAYAYAAYAAGARRASLLSSSAALVRERIPWPVVEAALSRAGVTP